MEDMITGQRDRDPPGRKWIQDIELLRAQPADLCCSLVSPTTGIRFVVLTPWLLSLFIFKVISPVLILSPVQSAGKRHKQL